MEYGKYRFLIKLDEEAFLPHYKGSTFRGLFGHALRRVVCALRHQECKTCLLRSSCTYALVFETALAFSLPQGSRISAPPHPVVLEPPLTEKTAFAKGETMECTLLLFGNINKNLPYFVYAFDQMGRIGMGKKIKGKRSKFTLETVSTDREVLYEKNKKKIKFPSCNEQLNCCNETSCSDTDEKELKIEFKTPLRIKKNNGRLSLPFQFMVNTMIRRTTSLLNCYGHGEPDMDYSAMAQRAGSIQTVEEDLTWYDWKRYSSRQDQKMFMGGISGSVTYRGNLQEFIPMVKMAEKVHLGKNTFFGLGQICQETIKNSAN